MLGMFFKKTNPHPPDNHICCIFTGLITYDESMEGNARSLKSHAADMMVGDDAAVEYYMLCRNDTSDTEVAEMVNIEYSDSSTIQLEDNHRSLADVRYFNSLGNIDDCHLYLASFMSVLVLCFTGKPIKVGDEALVYFGSEYANEQATSKIKKVTKRYTRPSSDIVPATSIVNKRKTMSESIAHRLHMRNMRREVNTLPPNSMQRMRHGAAVVNEKMQELITNGYAMFTSEAFEERMSQYSM